MLHTQMLARDRAALRSTKRGLARTHPHTPGARKSSALFSILTHGDAQNPRTPLVDDQPADARLDHQLSHAEHARGRGADAEGHAAYFGAAILVGADRVSDDPPAATV